MKFELKKEWFSISLLIIATIASFYFYANFPDQVPTHWNAAGEIDQYSGKMFGAFFFPALIIGIYLLLTFIPKIDPKKEKYEQFADVYFIFKSILTIFFTILYFSTSLFALGYNIKIGMVIPMAIGIMFIIMGNYMGKIKSNWFIGIRTPWTMSSEDVWNKTHRLGGKLFIALGLIFFIAPFMPTDYITYITVGAVALVVLSTFLYSYILYKKEK